MIWDNTDFRKPVNLVALAIGIGGVIATIITFLWSTHKAAISYYTASIQIVDQSEALPISVIDSAGQRVMENVYATNVTVWNSGDLPIEAQNIRSPLTISLSSRARLIDAKLEHATTDNISEFRIDNDTKKGSTIQISWRYFDPREGFRVRLVYAGNVMTSAKLDGVIFGVGSFDDVTPPPKGSFVSLRKPGIIPMTASGVILLVLGVTLLVARQTKRAVTPGFYYWASLCLLVTLGLEIYGIFLTSHPPGPPF
jgi:hypothetical protein